MSETGILDSLQRARKAADAVRTAAEKAREREALDPANAPPVILAKAAAKIVLDSFPVENPALREALIRKAGEMAASYEAGTKPLSTPSGDTSKRMKQL